MTRIHFNCRSGASGDMIAGSLLDLGVDAGYLMRELSKLGIEGYFIRVRKVDRKGVSATKFDVLTTARQQPVSLEAICDMIDGSALCAKVKKISQAIFWNLAVSEASAHNMSIERVHFHEVGALDSIIDVVSATVMLNRLDVKSATCGTIPLGCGRTASAHGPLDIPAPAVAHLLRGVPTTPTSIPAELTTPTGAAILKTIVGEYTEKFPETIKLGFGAGTKDLEAPNVLETGLVIF